MRQTRQSRIFVGMIDPSPPSRRDALTPMIVARLARGYGLADLRGDLVAGLTVAIVALPLALAIGIASGASPDRGIVTAVVAGVLISAFGGSNHQIGGPTAAFVVLVHHTIDAHGLEGLFLATTVAGVLLVVAGLLRLGRRVEHVPHTVVVGFTAGIGATILIGQARELLGLRAEIPVELIDKLVALAHALPETRAGTVLLAAGALALIVALQTRAPRVPAFLAAVVAGTLAVIVFGLDADTIGGRFGALPAGLPMPALPDLSPARILALLPSAIAIALLAGIESLLSCVIADRQTGEHHRPDIELVAQGIANIASAAFGGVSATGAIARTAANIRSGATSPVSGMAHAVLLLLFLLVAAPVLGLVPLAVLAAILAVVAVRIMELREIGRLLRAGRRWDRVVLVATFALTLLVDLTVGIAGGLLLHLAPRWLRRLDRG